MAGQLSVELGDYGGAIQDANAALLSRRDLTDEGGRSEDFNTLGLSHLYLGDYTAALSAYQQALDLDRKQGRVEGQIIREDNIGNVYYFQGRYSEALRSYESALAKVNATASEPWNPRRRQITLANLAALYQRLGQGEAALSLYRQIGESQKAMPPSERAQLLLNEGVLYRRMGDPVKALEYYRNAQALFASERHADGEIGALRNIGIARAVDWNDFKGAVVAFSSALELARRSSDRRGIAQASLYRAEALRRLGRPGDAEADARAALEAARAAGLVEEQWKAQYELGKIADDRGQTADAKALYEKAIAAIESVRAGLRQVSLRTEFLADKRDVYDSLIALLLRQPAASAREVWFWIERGRARTLLERVGGPMAVSQPSLEQIQARVAPDTVLLDFWVSAENSATVWITSSAAGVVRCGSGAGALADSASRLLASLERGDEEWRRPARFLGNELLSGVPLPSHVLVVPDGPLSAVPLEVLEAPRQSDLLIAKHDVTYLPASQFLLRGQVAKRWLPPWRIQFEAFGDPPVSAADTLSGSERWQPLGAAEDEIRGIAELLPGRSLIHLRADARKQYLEGDAVAGVPLLHFSTHAVADEENPDRSRMLLAPDSPGAGFDYLFEEEASNLNLHGVDLVTVSACDTARGKLIRGEGVQAFSRAFLEAGSAATITSLWQVPDRPTADFMKQFYRFLAQGQAKAQALRSAKLEFLRSGSTLSHPRYWGAFIVNGDGWDRTRRVIPWSVIAGLAALGCALAGAILWWITRRATDKRAPLQSA